MIRVMIVLFVSLIPVFIYCYLYSRAKRKALINGNIPPSFVSVTLLKAVIQFLSLALFLFLLIIVFSLYTDMEVGDYVPATVIDGKIVKGTYLDE